MSNSAPSRTGSKGVTQLGAFFRRKILSWRGADTGPTTSPATIYQEFSISGLDYSGQLSSGYGRTGGNLDATVTPDFGDVLLPAFLTLSLAIKAGVTCQKQALVVLQRLPKTVYGTRVSTYALPTHPPEPNALPLPDPVWSTAQPVTLQVLEGYYGQISLSGTATAGVGLPVATDELGIALSAELTATVGAECLAVKLADQQPAFFPSPSDSSLQLDAAVKALIGCTSKSEAKVEIENFLKEQMTKWFTQQGAGSILMATVTGLTPLTEEQITGVQAQARQALKEKIFARIEDELNRALSLIQVKATIGNLLQKAIDAWNKPTTAGLLGQLQQLKNQLGVMAADPATDAPTKAVLLADGQQINVYIDLLLFFQKVQTAPAATDYRGKLCRLNLLSANASFDVQATAVAGADWEVPESAGKLALNANATVIGNVQGMAQIVSYRYQSYAEGTGQPLVATQDTYITYRNVSGTAEVLAAAGVNSHELLNLGCSAGAYYRSMTYQAAITFWTYPLGTAATTPVLPLGRSGLVYGCSARLGRLAKVAEAAVYPTSMDAGTKTYIQNLARQLRVDVTALTNFLANSGLDELAFFTELGTLAQQGFPDTVYLEASFAFDASVRLEAVQKGSAPAYYALNDPFNAPSVRAFVSKLRTVTAPPAAGAPPPTSAGPLEAIRLRFRIADAESTSELLFALGFGDDLVSVDFSLVQSAGHEGFFDYYVQWYNNPAFNPTAADDGTTLPGDFKIPYERSVPPVALLHQ